MNKQRVRFLKTQIVTTHLAILNQTKLVNPTVESLEAAKQVADVLTGELSGGIRLRDEKEISTAAKKRLAK